MSRTVIQVEGLSKQYRLGQVGRKTISHDFNRWWHQVRGKEDPYLKIGQENDRAIKGTSDYVWSLRDINFEVKEGAVLGIIGRNGAGKSTLLKILSKVTKPTLGEIKLRGRVASLLEVGTGFHPDLSGRKNIYLNGAILGMTTREIDRKFDEIVDFAGVERYIDTPVKRYSSGMYVRLAFAVAAHLEPEILIVDEVLAVGDAEFQKKCLGKMKDVSINEGRTVLFVSHNMGAVQNLCTSGIVLQNGKVLFSGGIDESVNEYISNHLQQETKKDFTGTNGVGNENSKLIKAQVSNAVTSSFENFNTQDGFVLELEIDNTVKDKQQLDITYHLVNEKGILVCVNSTVYSEPNHYNNGRLYIKTSFPGGILNEGIYIFARIILLKNRGHILTEWKDVLTFEVLPMQDGQTGWQAQKEGVIKLTNIPWEITT